MVECDAICLGEAVHNLIPVIQVCLKKVCLRVKMSLQVVSHKFWEFALGDIKAIEKACSHKRLEAILLPVVIHSNMFDFC